MDWGQMAQNVAVLVIGLVGGRWTRKSAKESNQATKEANASHLYSQLTTGQGAELKRLSERLAAVEEDRDQSKQMNREHMKWDWILIRRLRIALPDEEFPDPPPLDT
jgi:hypothetical protein